MSNPLSTTDSPPDARVITTSQVSRGWVYGGVAMLVLGALFGNLLLFGLALLLLATLMIAWVWARYCLHALSFERRFSQPRAFYGEELDMTHVFTNNKPLPVPWLAVEDRYPGDLQIISDTVEPSTTARVRRMELSVSLGPYERVTRHYRVICTARGEHGFGPVGLQSGDVFGLFRRSEEVETPRSLIVYPRYVPVSQLGIAARQPFGDFRATQNLATDPLRLRTLREYAYGDNPRHIHWKASARRGALQTKLFEPAATPQLFIFCNQDTSTRMWQGLDRPTLELTISVAASLANYGLEEGYMVGLQVNAFAHSSDTQMKISPSRDPSQLTRILESLARVTGWSGLQMEELLRAQRRALPRGATIVVVTGFVSDDLLDTLVAIRRAGHPVTLVQSVASPEAVSHTLSGDALAQQGINYYLVESLDGAVVEELAFPGVGR